MSLHLVNLRENAYTVSGAILSPGFHFRPTPSEIISFLRCKNMDPDLHAVGLIPEIDVYAYKYLPGELLNNLPNGELRLYFFCPIARKYNNGSKKNRSTKIGNWRLTGKDKIISDWVQPVGKKKSLVFYQKDKRTNWMMHEYTLLDVQHSVEKQQTDSGKVEYALCKLFEKIEPDSKDNLQTEVSFGKSECINCAYRDSILFIPESHKGIFHLNECFSRITDKDECASSIRGNTDDSGTSKVESLTDVSQTDHGVPLEEVEIEGDDPSLLQDYDSNLEALPDEGITLSDLDEPWGGILHNIQKDQICTPDALKQQSDSMLLEDDLLNLLCTDQDLGTSVSERRNSCFQDSQPIEIELMDMDMGVGNGNSLPCCNSQKLPTFDREYECTMHELASSWANIDDSNADAESPCHNPFSDGRCLSDANVDEFWDLYGYPVTSGCDIPTGDLYDSSPLLWY